ncbi:MAG TPA: hypothetical protein VF641_04630 [Methylobacterium sp.]|jgi:hypothetical protein
MSPAAAAPALLPLAAALLAIVVTAATGFDQRTPLPAGLGPYLYGFFLDRYPLFAFAIVYGLARIAAGAAAPGPLVRRVLGGLAGIVLVLAVCLYPTFGGLALRGGFGVGSVAFLGQQPMALAYALGTAVTALLFGTAIGLGVLTIGRRREGTRGWGRRLAEGGATLVSRFLALWFAFAVLGLAREAGFGAWPRRPLGGSDLGVATALVLTAFLPHALLIAWRKRDESTVAADGDGLIRRTGYR